MSHGVYEDIYATCPERLPWARPLSPSYGGGAGSSNQNLLNQETGWCSVPHVDSQVFVFFENSDINYPVYFGVAQSGDGWFSEHPNQHRFQTDNIRIRVEENPDDERSTTKFDSYTSRQTNVAKENLYRKYGSTKTDQNTGVVKQQKTRLDVEIEASDMQAVNLNIHRKCKSPNRWRLVRRTFWRLLRI